MPKTTRQTKIPGDPVLPSEITPESVYLSRRAFMHSGMRTGALLGVGAMMPALGWAAPAWLQDQVGAHEPGTPIDEDITPEHHATSYNNFYEFGTDKSDPKRHAQQLTTDPWSVQIDGLVNRPGTYDLEDILAPHALEERIYRLRCVEAWSMVIPWLGFPLADLLARFEPQGSARYVEFTTLYRPAEMPGQRSRFSSIEYPYVEGLRLDEAMHPLTILAVGMYGKVLPNQNGAPLRLVVPWKYGFKSIKSIVRIRFTEQEPQTTWHKSAPQEYGFYANVNPNVDHPRWSQRTERRLPGSLFGSNRIPTRMFNGYADAVADLYRGMDLSRYY